ncbi:MAG TPA: NADP-dependent isocitrate dehydrogenase [Magnetospirillaceae bacterium]|nr:NADP-dependent isocitrate dehydrogenase [Magnetospirillaceae bacterium]
MKIRVLNPIAELDGDEMTRILWDMIKTRLLLPYLDVKLEYYDLHVLNRDCTDDAVTVEAANAVRRLKVGVKCATITPDANRVIEYGLKKEWPSPNGTLRNLLDGTVFRTPILSRNIQPAVRSWIKPITIGRHAYGDLYKAVDWSVPGPGTVELMYTPEGNTATVRMEVHRFKEPGVVLGMHNTDASIRSFARACANFALSSRLDVWFAAKDTISKKYHARFRDIFSAEMEARAPELSAAGVSYRYMLIDDAVAQILRHPGGVLWGCTNYDGDVFSDMVAAGFGSLGMMSSVLVSPDGAFEFEAAHGTVRSHYYERCKGNLTSTNPVATIFAWTGALRKRGELDGTAPVAEFADLLEGVVLGLVGEGVVTEDLVSQVQPRPEAFETTEGFLDKTVSRLESALAEGG